MKRFACTFGDTKCKIIGMIHVDALPGTPKYVANWNHTIEKAIYESEIYKKHKIDAVLIENMHDIPYVPEQDLGPETTACMTRLSHAVRENMPSQTPCGIQILAHGNRQALAVAKAAGLQFIRAEGFVFGHVADEGYTNACAGGLLRYRRQINAENVLVFTDLKKKHSSHAITSDVDLLSTAKAAEFFCTDGIVITGESTGHEANPKDLESLVGKVSAPLLIGSGVTTENVTKYFSKANAIIIGSHFKNNGKWDEELSELAVEAFMERVNDLRNRDF